MDFNFHKIANEIAGIPDEAIKELSWEDRINELLRFREYFKLYHDSYGEEYLDFLEETEKEMDLEKKEDLIYFFKKETLTKDINLDGLNFIFVNLMLKYGFEYLDYNDTIINLKEKHNLEFKHDWLIRLSRENLNLFESINLLNYVQRSDYWDYEHMPLSYAIFDGTIDNVLAGMERNLDEENLDVLDILLDK